MEGFLEQTLECFSIFTSTNKKRFPYAVACCLCPSKPLLVLTQPFISLPGKYKSGSGSLPKIWSSWFVENLSGTVAFLSNGFSYFPGMYFAAFVLAFVPAPSSVMLSQPVQLLKLSDRPFLSLKTRTTPLFELFKQTKCLRWSCCFVQRHADFLCLWLLIPKVKGFPPQE